MRSTQKHLGTWEPSQHLRKDRGKSRKPVSRRSEIDVSAGGKLSEPHRKSGLSAGFLLG
jgi:hypothetical protein